jgi:hypothetical protein
MVGQGPPRRGLGVNPMLAQAPLQRLERPLRRENMKPPRSATTMPADWP